MNRKKRRRWRAALVVVLLAAVLGCVLHSLVYRLYPQRYRQEVEIFAAEYELDPLLVYAFICTESGFDPSAESNVGARGLMQITDVAYSWIHSKLGGGAAEDFDTMYDAKTNIRYGCYYVAACLARYQGDVETAAAAYHSGWGTVDALLEQGQYSADGQVLEDFPYANMSRYVEKIHRNYTIYRILYGRDAGRI